MRGPTVANLPRSDGGLRSAAHRWCAAGGPTHECHRGLASGIRHHPPVDHGRLPTVARRCQSDGGPRLCTEGGPTVVIWRWTSVGIRRFMVVVPTVAPPSATPEPLCIRPSARRRLKIFCRRDDGCIWPSVHRLRRRLASAIFAGNSIHHFAHNLKIHVQSHF